MYQADVGTEILNATGLPSCCPSEVVYVCSGLHRRDTNSYIEYKAEKRLLANSNMEQEMCNY